MNEQLKAKLEASQIQATQGKINIVNRWIMMFQLAPIKQQKYDNQDWKVYGKREQNGNEIDKVNDWKIDDNRKIKQELELKKNLVKKLL